MNGVKLQEWGPPSLEDASCIGIIDIDVKAIQAPKGSQESNSDSGTPASSHQKFHSHMLRVHVLKGCELAAKDHSGSSDPYVRVKVSDKVLFKTRKIFQNLNPVWDERFECPTDNVETELRFEVFDYDRIGKDDYMGSAVLTLADMEEKQINELKLTLKDDSDGDKYMGYIIVNVSLTPLTLEEAAQLRARRTIAQTHSIKPDSGLSLKRFKKGTHAPMFQVNIVLAEGRNLVPAGTLRSRAASKTCAPKWLEQFELRSYCQADQQMEMDVLDRRRDDLIGRCTIDLSKLPKNITNHCWYQLENGAGEILLLITLSPIKSLPHDERSFETKTSEDTAAVTDNYKPAKTFKDMSDVGFLVVKVYKAVGLASADVGTGKSDPFCVLELVNDRVQTSTVYKSLSPEWNQYFTFAVKDIHSVLEVTVYDEDRNSEPEFLGKVGVPLLKICEGQKRWYALKDHNLLRRAKGQILLEMKLMWNPIRAAVRTFSPKEPKYIARPYYFRRKLLLSNLNRLKSYVAPLRDLGAYIQSCFTWESPLRSLIAFIVFLLVTYHWHAYMIPVFILSIFAWCYMAKAGILGPKEQSRWEEEYVDSADESEDEESPNESDKNVTLAEKFRGLQDKLFELQSSLDFVASTIERIRNVFTFSQPFLSFLAVIIFTAATVLLYCVPLRYLIMAWGINKFTKRFRRKKGFVPNNEVLDYLSRVFSDEETRMYGEFYVLQTPINSKT